MRSECRELDTARGACRVGERAAEVLLITDQDIHRAMIDVMCTEAGMICHTVEDHNDAIEHVMFHTRVDAIVIQGVVPTLELAWLIQQMRDLRPDVMIAGAFDYATVAVDLPIDFDLPAFWTVDDLARHIPLLRRVAA